MNRREMVYDIFVGKESQPLGSGVSSEEALAAQELFQDVRIEPRSVFSNEPRPGATTTNAGLLFVHTLDELCEQNELLQDT